MRDRIRLVKDWVHFLVAEPLFLKTLLKVARKNSSKCILFGTPVHGNLGDHLIGESEKQFLTQNFTEYELIECTMPFSKRFMNTIKKRIDKNTPIFISGGGWLGTEWKHNEEYVRKILALFKHNPILIFSQTVFYQGDEDYIESGREVYSSCSNLTFCVRDKQS